MIDYLDKRAQPDRNSGKEPYLPQPKEIALLEVFKKLTESGWIVKLEEFKQILGFVEIQTPV
jgi:hypothetical protein